jgi:hypothetical protein
VNIYDEGIILTGAMRILSGEIPSVDFYVNYGPGQFYFVALLIKLFGLSLDVMRIYHAFVLAFTILASFMLMSFSESKRYILIPLLFISILLLKYGTLTPLYPASTCIPLLLIGCFFSIRQFNLPLRFFSFAPLALIISIIVLFRYDIGLMAAAAFSVPVFLMSNSDFNISDFKCRINFKETALYAVTVGASISLVFMALYIVGILEPALSDILTYNTANYAEMRSLPFPEIDSLFTNPIDFLMAYLPVFSISFALITCVCAAFQMRETEGRLYFIIILLTVVTLGCFLKGFVRVHPIHMLMANIHASILLFFCLQCFLNIINFNVSEISKKSIFIISNFFSSTIFLVILYYIFYNSDVYISLLSRPLIPHNVPALGSHSIDLATLGAAQFIIKETLPDDRILVANGRHDRTVVNDVSFYYLVQRLPGTRWHHYDPGVQTTAGVQFEMIEELELFSVDWIVVNSRFDNIREPNKSAETNGALELDNYLLSNYCIVKKFGNIEIKKRCY